jgi:predicted helicase
MHYSPHLIEMRNQMPALFPDSGSENLAFSVSDAAARSDFSVLAMDSVPEYHLCASTDGFQVMALYRYDTSGHRVDNITDWGLRQFEKRYGKGAGLTREAIFHYVYAVLHDPAYRQKYALNLKRELPRIPLYADFAQWSAWGKVLLDLHIGFEAVTPWPLTRHELPGIAKPRSRLKAEREAGRIVIDDATTLSGIPPAAWDYRLGNRSALEWVLDQYKETLPRDPTIREKFNTYRLADYKEKVIDLLGRVCTVSVETIKIISTMTQKES